MVIVRACTVRVVPTSSIKCIEDSITVVVWHEGGRGDSNVFTGNDKMSSVEDSIDYNDYHSLTVVCQLCNWFCERVTYVIESVIGYG